MIGDLGLAYKINRIVQPIHTRSGVKHGYSINVEIALKPNSHTRLDVPDRVDEHLNQRDLEIQRAGVVHNPGRTVD